jgi:hypothetical protein
MTNLEQRLRDAGILVDDIETQIQSADTALVLTGRELILLEDHRVQRARLRDITGVKIVKTGELSVRSASEAMIEGNVLGFEKTERKLFFDAVKEATARAKASVTNASLPGLTPPSLAPVSSQSPAVADTEPPPPARDPLKDTSDDWRALLSAPASDSPPVFSDPPVHNDAFAARAQVDPSLDGHAPNPLASVAVEDWAKSSAVNEPDPWTANKQTFEVEPEKPAPPPSNDPWVPATASETTSTASPVAASAPSSWEDPFDPPTTKPSEAHVTSVQVSNDWGGETLNASTALGATGAAAAGMVAGAAGAGVVEQAERKVTVLGADNVGTLLSVSRWLKILGVVFGLSSTAFVATLAPSDSANVLGYLILIPIMLGSILLALMAWGLGELMHAYASSSQDLRTIRRATLGH